jgi:hypothetical protein
VNGFALDRRPVTRDLVLDVCRDFDLGASAVVAKHADTPAPDVLRPPSAAADDPVAEEPALAEGAPRRRFRFF